MGGLNSYTFTGKTSQLSYRPYKFSGESDFIKALRKEASTPFPLLLVSVAYERPCLLSTLWVTPNKFDRQWKKVLPQFFRTVLKQNTLIMVWNLAQPLF